ncbi:MAG: response regulator transcription factor [Pseudomonadota bacterium]|nr:response regulator transcription factor [Pseudomonadota bacterium]
MSALIRVLVADDHTIVRQGIVSLLRDSGVCEVVAEAANGVEAVEKAMTVRPAVALIDITMPRLNGLEVVRRIRQALPDTRVLVLTVHDDEEYVLPIVRAGATGYLLKNAAATELVEAVQTLNRGKAYFGPEAARIMAEQLQNPGEAQADPYQRLTPREREVFHLVVEGKASKEISRLLGISVKTAENHRARLMEKLSVHNTAELVKYAARKGLL